jgi:hypothetical protein
MKKYLVFALAVILAATLLAACGGGGLPNGRYEPTEDYETMSPLEAIIVNGNNFTFTYAMGAVSQTSKYTYKNGTITFQDGSAAINVACTYDESDGILTWAGIEFEKK